MSEQARESERARRTRLQQKLGISLLRPCALTYADLLSIPGCMLLHVLLI